MSTNSIQHNIRTIAQLNKYDIKNINDISSPGINFEISHQDNSTFNTYKITAVELISALCDYIFSVTDSKYVTISGDQQTITSPKVFNCGISCLSNVIISASNNTTSLLSCNSPINGEAMSAWWA